MTQAEAANKAAAGVSTADERTKLAAAQGLRRDHLRRSSTP